MRAAHPRHPAAAAVLTVAAVLVASCSSSPWYSFSGMCGPPALVRVDGHVRFAGNCADALTVPALTVRVHAGQLIDIHMTEADTGPSGNRLVPIYPLPHSSRPSVLLAMLASPDRATGTYQAVRPGRAVLQSDGSCLVEDHGRPRGRTGSCPVTSVVVIP